MHNCRVLTAAIDYVTPTVPWLTQTNWWPGARCPVSLARLTIKRLYSSNPFKCTSEFQNNNSKCNVDICIYKCILWVVLVWWVYFQPCSATHFLTLFGELFAFCSTNYFLFTWFGMVTLRSRSSVLVHIWSLYVLKWVAMFFDETGRVVTSRFFLT